MGHTVYLYDNSHDKMARHISLCSKLQALCYDKKKKYINNNNNLVFGCKLFNIEGVNIICIQHNEMKKAVIMYDLKFFSRNNS